MNVPLDWFATGYCIAHSDATSQWCIDFNSLSTPRCIKAFCSGLHSSTIKKYGSITSLIISPKFTKESCISGYLANFRSIFPYTKEIESLMLYGELFSDSNNVSANVLQKLSDFCPKLTSLTLPRLHLPYLLSLVPQFPRHTLNSLFLTLPFMKDDSALVPELQQCLALKRLRLSAVNQ